MDKHMNPFTSPYKASVYAENILDPKMGIPQNEELFNHVIKFANKERGNNGHDQQSKSK